MTDARKEVAVEPFMLIWLYVLVYYHFATHVLFYGKEQITFIKDVLVFYTVYDAMHFNKLPRSLGTETG